MPAARRLARWRNRVIWKTVDAAVTLPLRRAAVPARRVLDPRLSNYDRMGAVLGLFDRAASSTLTAAMTRRVTDSRLPVTSGRREVLDYGSGATVFLITTGATAYVLKVYRRTIGLHNLDLFDMADHFRSKIRRVQEWYAEDVLLVLPSSVIIGPSPHGAAGCVAVLQPYVAMARGDLFDWDPDRLAGRVDQALRSQLSHFALRTLELADGERRCLDLLGHGNVVLVSTGQSTVLRILDFGAVDLRDRVVARAYQPRLDWLRRLARNLE